MMKLKSWPQFFNEILEGNKKHELRRSTDRCFEVGMHYLLQEYDPQSMEYTGREQEVKITYITDSNVPCALSDDALNSDYCILSIEVVK
jgi:hypothetical protein